MLPTCHWVTGRDFPWLGHLPHMPLDTGAGLPLAEPYCLHAFGHRLRELRRPCWADGND